MKDSRGQNLRGRFSSVDGEAHFFRGMPWRMADFLIEVIFIWGASAAFSGGQAADARRRGYRPA